MLVRALALGVCGTDREIVDGRYGSAPDGAERLIIGHKSLGEVEEAPANSGFARGELVVGIVRRPDPVPCRACASGEWDMCRNGRYTERGIKQRNGYGSEQFRVEPDFLIKIDPALGPLGVLLEPASVVAKAWEHTMYIGARSASWRPRKALITGAGPVGLLAAMIGAQRGIEIHILDRAESGPKPALARALGATYHVGSVADVCPDVVIECTGAASVILDVVGRTAADGIVCLAGVSSGGHTARIRYRRAESHDGVEQRDDVRLGQRQSEALSGCGRCACARGPALALRPDQQARATGALAGSI